MYHEINQVYCRIYGRCFVQYHNSANIFFMYITTHWKIVFLIKKKKTIKVITLIMENKRTLVNYMYLCIFLVFFYDSETVYNTFVDF